MTVAMKISRGSKLFIKPVICLGNNLC